MLSSNTLADVLQQLHASGYRLADAQIAALPDADLHARDWRLDSLQQVKHHAYRDHKVLVIAVSSKSRNLKLVFVEVVYSLSEFSPITLLRRLFPGKRPGSTRPNLAA